MDGVKYFSERKNKAALNWSEQRIKKIPYIIWKEMFPATKINNKSV